jgi:hypothetical protein
LQATTARSRRIKSDPQPAASPRPVRPSAPRAAQPQTDAPDQRGQLLVEDGAAGAVCIAEQAWAPGLGWYTQRTLSVPDEQLDELIAQLRFARARRRARPGPGAGRKDSPRRPAPGVPGGAAPVGSGAGRAAGATILPFRPRPAGV